LAPPPFSGQVPKKTLANLALQKCRAMFAIFAKLERDFAVLAQGFRVDNDPN
jgi:hypothetical protein